MTPSRSTRVALVVLNWNGKDDTLRCLESLRRVTYPELTIIVVDNASTDDSCAAIRETHPDIRLVPLAWNRGYTGGNNAGIERALSEGADVVGVLNNDTVVDPGFLEPLMAELDRDEMAIVSPRIVYMEDPDTAWFSGSYLDPRVGITYHQSEDSLSVAELAVQVRETVALTGCCLLARRLVWERVGLFDDRYFLIFEDADWCARARRLGCRSKVITSSSVAHAVGASFVRSRSTVGDYFYVRNGLLYLSEHSESRFRRSTYLIARVLRESARRLVHQPTPYHARAMLAQMQGIGAFVTGRFGPRDPLLRKRWAETTVPGS